MSGGRLQLPSSRLPFSHQAFSDPPPQRRRRRRRRSNPLSYLKAFSDLLPHPTLPLMIPSLMSTPMLRRKRRRRGKGRRRRWRSRRRRKRRRTRQRGWKLRFAFHFSLIGNFGFKKTTFKSRFVSLIWSSPTVRMMILQWRLKSRLRRRSSKNMR